MNPEQMHDLKETMGFCAAVIIVIIGYLGILLSAKLDKILAAQQTREGSEP